LFRSISFKPGGLLKGPADKLIASRPFKLAQAQFEEWSGVEWSGKEWSGVEGVEIREIR
jgi:hypothetical protein